MDEAVALGIMLFDTAYSCLLTTPRQDWHGACDHFVGGGQANSEVIAGVHDAARHYNDAVTGERIPLARRCDTPV
jgi:hypothetical protein